MTRVTMAVALHLTFEDGLIVRHHMQEGGLAVERAFAVDDQACRAGR